MDLVGCSKQPIRPYVSKRKRKAQQQEILEVTKKPLASLSRVKDIFLTNEIIYKQTLKTPHYNSPPFSCKKIIKISDCPLWSVKWCKNFSHIIACTTGKSVKLFDVMKDKEICCVWGSLDDKSSFKDTDWSRTSRQLTACNFDKKIVIWDFLDAGKVSSIINLDEVPSVIRYWPEDERLIIVGGESSFLATYDVRSGKIATKYPSKCGNILSLDVLTNSGCFVAAGDSVNEQSAEHSLIVWDFATGAKISDQIFLEKYTCPKVCVHPSGSAFLAQTNGSYIARFNATKPYRLDKCLRYDQHKVDGYSIGLDISSDGRMVVSGSLDGSVVFYKYKDSSVLRKLHLPVCQKKSGREMCAGVSVQCHPILPTMVAVGDWSGRLHILE